MLLPSTYYHIYNRANGWEDLFKNEENYRFFMEKCSLYLNPVAHLYAWCLIPNHFHLLIKTKEEQEILGWGMQDPRAGQTFRKFAEPPPGKLSEGCAQASALLSKQFQKLFSSYTQSFNKVYRRKGSLFIPNFKYKTIESPEYLLQVALYIHRNPVHHGLCRNTSEWRHSSWNFIVNHTHEKAEAQELVSWFGGINELIEAQTLYQAEIIKTFEDEAP